MRSRVATVVTVVACLLFLAVLGWPYAVKSASDITTYYTWGVLTPLLGGVLVLGALVVLVAVREERVSPAFGAGLVFGLGLFAFLVTVAWAATARVDVFLAPGWALPAQRFVLAGLSFLIVVGAGAYVRTTGLLSRR